MEYAALAERLREIEAADADHAKRDLLVHLFEHGGNLLPDLVLLVRGRVHERWESADLCVSSSLTQRAVIRATGVSANEVEERWKESGDLGTAAEWAVRTAASGHLPLNR